MTCTFVWSMFYNKSITVVAAPLQYSCGICTAHSMFGGDCLSYAIILLCFVNSLYALCSFSIFPFIRRCVRLFTVLYFTSVTLTIYIGTNDLSEHTLSNAPIPCTSCPRINIKYLAYKCEHPYSSYFHSIFIYFSAFSALVSLFFSSICVLHFQSACKSGVPSL